MSDAVPPRKPFGYAKSQPNPEPQFEVVEDETELEIVEETKPAKKRPARVESLEIEEDESKSKKRPKRTKNKRFKPAKPEFDEDEARRNSALRHYEWTMPSIVLGIGMVLTFVCAMGALKSAGGGVLSFLFLTLGILVSIPITIAALMVVGMACGIEYGRLGPAILKIAAISFIANGIMYLGEWIKFPLIVFPISCFVTFGLFMTLFDLDTWETNASVGAINVLAYLSKWALIFLLIGMAHRVDRNRVEPDSDEPEIQEKVNKRAKDRGDKLPNPNPGGTKMVEPDDDDN